MTGHAADSVTPEIAVRIGPCPVCDRIALVGLANLTGRAMDDNLECGILIRSGRGPRLIRDHISGLAKPVTCVGYSRTT